MLSITDAGLQASIQDLGRPGFAGVGVRACGALDKQAMQIANLLVNNTQQAAVVEFAGKQFSFEVQQAAVIAVAGFHARISVKKTTSKISRVRCWQPVAVSAGEHVTIESDEWSVRHYIAVSGGFDGELVMRSRSSDLFSAFGGLHGRILQRGDVLTSCNKQATGSPTNAVHGNILASAPILDNQLRCLPGPEYGDLPAEAQQALWTEQWQIQTDSNRMGCRLAPFSGNRATNKKIGRALAGEEKKLLSLRSHAVMPGTVQWPVDGQPIVLLADAQTTGGYPRAAKVIDADLWKLAHLPTGSTLNFRQADAKTAVAAMREQQQQLYRLQLAVQHLTTGR